MGDLIAQALQDPETMRDLIGMAVRDSPVLALGIWGVRAFVLSLRNLSRKIDALIVRSELHDDRINLHDTRIRVLEQGAGVPLERPDPPTPVEPIPA
jgi:hypothetical protein